MLRQIIALGGGGFLMESQSNLLDSYILKASGKQIPKICFLPTASGDSQIRINQFYNHFRQEACVPSHLSLFRGHTQDIQSFLLNQDIIYVGGGNTRNMILLWKEWEVDKIISAAYQKGIVLCGVSAGSICWFEEGLSDSIPQKLTKVAGLGLIPGSNCPHFDGEPERRAIYTSLINQGIMQSGIGTDDHCALHYINEKLHKVVAETENAHAYAFSKEDSNLQTNILEAEFLGKVSVAKP